MQDFRKLKVWEKAHALTLVVYRMSGSFPQHEQFGMRSQLRRSAYLIPSKIAEGCGRSAEGEFPRYLYAAMGSASELEYSILLARDLGYILPDLHQSLEVDTVEVKRMLAGLINAVRD